MQELVLHLRKCTVCGEEKPIEDFYVCDKASGRRRGNCKICERVRVYNYKEPRKESISKRQKEYYENNPDKKLERIEYEKKYWEQHKEKKFEIQSRYRKNNRDRIRQMRQEKIKEIGIEEHRKRRKEERSRNLDTYRNNEYKRKFGITIDEYNNMFIEQGGSCAICGIHQSALKRKLAVDHCHKTGKVRGLLCSNCNNGIGSLKDNIDILENAKKYLLMNK